VYAFVFSGCVDGTPLKRIFKLEMEKRREWRLLDKLKISNHLKKRLHEFFRDFHWEELRHRKYGWLKQVFSPLKRL